MNAGYMIRCFATDSRAEVLWLRYREQRELCDRLPDETTEEEHERARRELVAIEGALRADIFRVGQRACLRHHD
jgi:hypothetical protein